MRRRRLTSAIAWLLASNLAAFAASGVGEGESTDRTPLPLSAFESQSVEVALGDSGQTIILMTTDDGGYTLNGERIASGATHMAANGNYTLTLADGVWTATFAPQSVQVALGTSGESVVVTQVEAGGWTLPDGTMIGPATVTETSDGDQYGVTVRGDGTPTAIYLANPVEVTLGMLGGTIKLYLQEDETTWLLEGTGEAFTSGGDVSVDVMGVQNTYTLTRGADGTWSAAYRTVTETVDLGTSDQTVTLTRAEDTKWRIGESEFVSGGEHKADNDNVYRLSYGEDGWTATYVPATMMIAGTAFNAEANEDGSGYTIAGLEGQTLDETGAGTILSPDGKFRVRKDADGNLQGVQYEDEVNIETGDAAKGTSFDGGTATAHGRTRPVTIGDDTETADVNEAGTLLTIDGVDHSVGTLYTTGMSTVEGDSIVAGVRDQVQSLVGQIKGLKAVNDQESEDGQTDFSTQFDAKWKEIDDALDTIFGDDATNPSNDLDHLAERPEDANDMIAVLDAIVVALADEDGFVAAFDEDGVFEGLIPAEDSATIPDVFNARVFTATAYLSRTENARFGVYRKQTRTVADVDLGDAATGVFAYSPLLPTKTGDLPSGGASYAGTTMAIDGTGTTIYNGDIALQVRFTSRRVSGLVSNLTDGDGEAFMFGVGEVDTIILAQATIDPVDGSFRKAAESDAQIVFTAVPGSPATETLEGDGSAFAGQLVGESVAAIGTWSIGADATDQDLKGAFGAERGEDLPDPEPEASDRGATAKTSIHAALTSQLSGVTVSAVDAETGVITLVPMAEDDTPPVPSDITVNGTDVYDQGDLKITDTTFVAEVVTEIKSLLDRLDAYIDLEELGLETVADAGRETIWTELKEQIDTIFGTGTGAQLLSEAYPVDNAATPDQDDRAAKSEINQILDALSSVAQFKTATGNANGVLHAASGTLTDEAAGEIFERASSTVTVKGGHTTYTRFGVWNRAVRASATDDPAAPDNGANGLFAYSQLSATTYTTTDPNFPAGFSGTYEGNTVARSESNHYYSGRIELAVTWAANVDTAANVGTVYVAIYGLRNDAGALYSNGSTVGGVSTIIFDDAIQIARNDSGHNELTFSGDSDVRLRYADITQTDASATSSINGVFVGKSIDGPLGVLGSWTLTNSGDGENLQGAYGADLPF